MEYFEETISPQESSSPHNPEYWEAFREISGLEWFVDLPQVHPICAPEHSNAIGHREHSSRQRNEGKVVKPLDSTVPDERSTHRVHNPHHETSLTFTLISQDGQSVKENYFPPRQNDTRSLLASSEHHEGRIYPDLYLQRESVPNLGNEFAFTVCNPRLTSQANLQQNEEIHTSERSTAYNTCNRIFTANNDLLQHNESHKGEGSFACTECDKKFSQKGNLTRHHLTHTGKRPHKCDICTYASARKGGLKRHRRMHTGERPFKCESCGSAFSQLSDLTTHRRMHTGERPFKCEICGYAFPQSNCLKKHRRTHTGERPYKCKFCDYASAQLTNLKTHIKRQHENMIRETSADSPTSQNKLAKE